MEILQKVFFFIVAIGVLVTVHEFGHYWVARRAGIKVLRFSIGFGRPLLSWVRGEDKTEYVIAAIPLGGYVKMVDTREGDIAEQDLPRAFDKQSLAKRTAVVAAGPVFNFILAILAYWMVFQIGETGARPLVGQLASNGVAVEAGFMPGDEFVSISGEKTPTWSSVAQRIATTVMAGEDLSIRVQGEEGFVRDLVVNAAVFGEFDENTDVLKTLGIEPAKPQIPAIVGEVIPNGPAEKAGLQQGDVIKAIDGQPVEDWFAWVKWVRDNPDKELSLNIQRNGSELALRLTPERVEQGGEVFGRVGLKAQAPSEDLSRYRTEIILGPVDAFVGAVDRTAEYSWLTLKVLGRMLIGEASVKNLSGPLTIADVAGQTASFGLVAFLKFLAIVSISLGVLNLLPVPMLDGGHLLYFAVEAVTGKSVSEAIQLRAQQIGIAVLASVMFLAFYVDFTRYFG